MSMLTRNEGLTIAAGIAATILAGILTYAGAGAVLVFFVSGVALAILASLVGLATEQLGARLGPAATGILQSALGNLPELFVGIFSLQAGLIKVVQAALVGSILGNSLLVLGLAFLVGGLRNGTQRFASEPPRLIATLMLLAVAALLVPTLANYIHTPAGAHADALSLACALILLIVFIASIPVSLSSDPTAQAGGESHGVLWPLWLSAAVLTVAGVGSALVSDWFVEALRPAIAALHISEAFTGLVIVAIAGNAVENVVGIQLAVRNKTDYAISVILNSSLQVALALTPVLVLLSFVIGSTHLTLVLPPLLVAALSLATLSSTFIVYDGESIWLEGVALVGLYSIIAASFWWG
ncbi:MAG TPA: calcium/proton exchanger [Herpetosiphonaceae bacterium]|nr:calcium/proton exchanger [Herpetosiphonaceae bacterium]